MRALAVVSLLLGALPASAGEAPYAHVFLRNQARLRDRVAREVVRVHVLRTAQADAEQRLRFDGGGVHVGGGRIVTSAFLVDGASDLRVVLPGGRQEVPARVRRSMPALGLALLDIGPGAGLTTASLAAERAERGAAVYVLLNPASDQAQLRVGWMLESSRTTFYARTTLFARNGHPLYDEWGRVAGIGCVPAADGVTTLVIPAWAIRKLLDADEEPGGTRPGR
jgi:hypothetical protein